MEIQNNNMNSNQALNLSVNENGRMSSDKWIKTNIENVKNKYETCVNKKEDEIASYVLAVGQLLNGVSGMQNPYIYRYERRILFDSLPVFMRFFFEQVDNALNEKDIEEKIKIHLDISDSVQRIMTVYRNIIGSMMNADSQISSSNFAIDTNLYQLSPKITAFYSDILRQIVSLYKVDDDTENSNYSFLLYPSLESLTQSNKLFKERKKSGSFVIIYMSECLMESLDTVPIMLMHEAFHFLGRTERNRKKRAKILNQLVNQYIFERLNVNIPQEFSEEVNIVITDYFRKNVNELRDQINGLEDDNEYLYGHYTEKWIANEYEVILLQMLEHDFVEALLEYMDNSEKDYEIQLCDFENIRNLDITIKENILEILKNDIVGKASKIFMELLREVYADIIMVLLSKVYPKLYNQVFEESILINRGTERKDIARLLRQYYVAKVVAECFQSEQDETGEDLVKKWEKYCSESEKDLNNNKNIEEPKVDEPSIGNTKLIKKTKLYITHSSARDVMFIKYFKRCAKDAYGKICNIESKELLMFRKNFNTLVSSEKEKLLMCIYSGARFNNISDRYSFMGCNE